ncbi:MAG: glycoside hydrolase family 99-like domain-containing protein [Kiritimatiellia bacterium]
MKKLFNMLLFFRVFLSAFALDAVDLPDWNFRKADADQWIAGAHQCEQMRVENGVLKGMTAGRDPFFTSPNFDIPATASQAVEFRAKCSVSGKGEFFWIPRTAEGPQQKWSAHFDWIGDDKWHDYSVRPFWQRSKRIGAIRLDLPNGVTEQAVFEMSSIKIVDQVDVEHRGVPLWRNENLSAWKAVEGAEAEMKDGLLQVRFGENTKGVLVSPALSVDSDMASVFSVEMMVEEGELVVFEWASSVVSGLHSKNIKLKPDGRFHTYNIDLYADKNWKGDAVLLQLSVFGAGNNPVAIRSIQLSDEPHGPADISVLQARQVNAINRAASPVPVYMQLKNSGGKDAGDLRLSIKSLPEGVKVKQDLSWRTPAEVVAGNTLTHTFEIQSAAPVKGIAEFVLAGSDVDNLIIKLPLDILPDLNLPKADYVPQPQPVASDYEVGALYFPGWSQISAWERIRSVAPERKPVLGWYDETNPEVVDWQIKWAVENGLSYFMVDWYWHKGYQHHDHWIKAFKKARYKSYMKFALMWANHNARGSHSIEDQKKVAQFWIENYFNMPEYYRIDDKPVVMIWNPRNMERDVGKGGCRKLLDLSRQMARDAGYKGIYFIAMKWPEASTEPEVIQGLKEMGFDITTIYHFRDHGGKAETPRRFSFDLVADANEPFWRARHETGILPFIPNLSTGWDSRPLHGDNAKVIYGRTVGHFQRICRDAKEFADDTGVKRLILAPINEWGEGSYAEPGAEFGFGMYEAVRDAFCKKPADGWPLNYAPADVGLGPYDLLMPKPDLSTEWSFKNGMSGWSMLMGIEDSSTGEAGLTLKSNSHDPAIDRRLDHYKTGDFSRIAVRMKVPLDIKGSCQLFWSRRGRIPTEATSLSLPLNTDGRFHDYVFEVAKKSTWRGRIGYLRFDPTTASGVQVTIESIRLVPAE